MPCFRSQKVCLKALRHAVHAIAIDVTLGCRYSGFSHRVLQESCPDADFFFTLSLFQLTHPFGTSGRSLSTSSACSFKSDGELFQFVAACGGRRIAVYLILGLARRSEFCGFLQLFVGAA